MKKDYVILVSPEFPKGYLSAESDEDDDAATAPPRTAHTVMALRFSNFQVANRAMRAAVIRYPEHQFRIDVVEPMRQGGQP